MVCGIPKEKKTTNKTKRKHIRKKSYFSYYSFITNKCFQKNKNSQKKNMHTFVFLFFFIPKIVLLYLVCFVCVLFVCCCCCLYMHHPTDKLTHTTAFFKPVVEHWVEREIVQWVLLPPKKPHTNKKQQPKNPKQNNKTKTNKQNTTAFVTPVVEHWLEREIAPFR